MNSAEYKNFMQMNECIEKQSNTISQQQNIIKLKEQVIKQLEKKIIKLEKIKNDNNLLDTQAKYLKQIALNTRDIADELFYSDHNRRLGYDYFKKKRRRINED